MILTKQKEIKARVDELTFSQFETIRQSVENEFGIKMNNSELIRYIIKQLAEGIKK